MFSELHENWRGWSHQLLTSALRARKPHLGNHCGSRNNISTCKHHNIPPLYLSGGCVHTGPFIACFTYQTDHNCYFLCDYYFLCYFLICFRNVNNLFLNFLYDPLKPLEIYSNLFKSIRILCSYVEHKNAIISRSLKFWPIRVNKPQTANTVNKIHAINNFCRYFLLQTLDH